MIKMVCREWTLSKCAYTTVGTHVCKDLLQFLHAQTVGNYQMFSGRINQDQVCILARIIWHHGKGFTDNIAGAKKETRKLLWSPSLEGRNQDLN